MSDRQYKFVMKDKKKIRNTMVYRIKATESFETPFGRVNVGDLGGYICRDTVLNFDSWIFGNAVLINSWASNNSYIIGDYVYKCLGLENTTINGKCDYITGYGRTRMYNMVVEGSDIINAQPRVIIWGKHKETQKTIVCVGCQQYSIADWKTYYRNIAYTHGFEYNYIPTYLNHLKTIEDSLKPSNEKILEKISSYVEAMKKTVTEALKIETVTLLNTLTVSKSTPKVVEKPGPKRDPNTGRFLKKTP